MPCGGDHLVLRAVRRDLSRVLFKKVLSGSWVGNGAQCRVRGEVRRAGTDTRIWAVATGKEQRDRTSLTLKEELAGLGVSSGEEWSLG